ncbi:MAG: aminotransferase class I/II-fold pyridoxal phosphate-dependent enzyme [Legionellaceae bacterium]|nr:aminotransferase class I/II-fold pyridoxal phosphate-dependent enzyme [Legionellaceae bacterium]
MTLEQSLQDFLSALDKQGMLRSRPVHHHGTMADAIDFCSNDYLGFSHHSEVRAFFQEGFLRHPVGSGASSLISGYHPAHQALEQEFCQYLQCDAALLFSSGYTANLGVTALLGRLGIPTLIDKSVHASIYDGLQLAKAQYERFPHQHIALMHQKLRSHSVVLTEGIFSMSGYAPNLAEMRTLTRARDALLVVDEAHSFGILGDEGLGAVHQAALSQEDVPLRVIPFGKAFAAMGAIVVGQQNWIDVLLQVARSCIYSTAISPALAFGITHSFRCMRQASGLRERLQRLTRYFTQQRQNSTLHWLESDTPVQRLIIGDPCRARHVQLALEEQGVQAQLIRYPSVTIPETGLRFCVRADHREEDIDRLFSALDGIEERLKLSSILI